MAEAGGNKLICGKAGVDALKNKRAGGRSIAIKLKFHHIRFQGADSLPAYRGGQVHTVRHIVNMQGG
ncbi:MAG TPA: hypothetical protein DEA44_03205 [Firmicutes bacterium]|nr:hypothetical protein [Bacillota bacterium]